MVKASAKMQTANDELMASAEGASGEPPPAGRGTGRRFPLPVPLPSLINFSALILLFGGIFLLRQLGDGAGPGAAARENPAGGAQVEISSISALPTAPAPQEPAAEVLPPPQTENATEGPSTPDTLAGAPAPVVEPTPERPIVDSKQLEADRRAIKRYEDKRSAAKREPGPSLPSAYAEDRSFPLSELDNEAARRRYLAANRGLSGGEDRGPEVAAPPGGEGPHEDFIPFER